MARGCLAEESGNTASGSWSSHTVDTSLAFGPASWEMVAVTVWLEAGSVGGRSNATCGVNDHRGATVCDLR